MNELRRIAPSGHDLDRIRDVVSKHLSPELISDYFVEFGAFDDEPAMFITFHTAGPRPAFDDVEGRKARAERLRLFKDAIHMDLLIEFENRYPFYRFGDGSEA